MGETFGYIFGVNVVIWTGIILYLFKLDRKMSKIIKSFDKERSNNEKQ